MNSDHIMTLPPPQIAKVKFLAFFFAVQGFYYYYYYLGSHFEDYHLIVIITFLALNWCELYCYHFPDYQFVAFETKLQKAGRCIGEASLVKQQMHRYTQARNLLVCDL